ncbi:MAG: cytochrome c3 family protein [Polyangiaceae bacterium]
MKAWRGAREPGSWLAVGLCAAIAAACSSRDTASSEPQSARCATCHLQEFQSTTHPPHPGVRPTTCGVCHTESSWHPSRLVHSFPLAGAHAKAACFACHEGTTPTFEGTTTECARCHGRERETANAKVPHHDTFEQVCSTCHTTEAWKPALAHDSAFPSASIAVVASPPVSTVKPAGTGSAHTLPPKAKPVATRTTPWPTNPGIVSGASQAKKR